MGYTQEIGRISEDAAAVFLRDKGFVIRHRNWREGRYELDIIAEKDDMLHFVEVKCRKSGGLTLPEDSMTPAKFASLTKAANAYVACYETELETQFDLICVLHNGKQIINIDYYPAVMYCRW